MDGIFLQQLVNGLTLGSVYGLIAIGYTMVYGIIGMINFAHGEVYMISAYLAAISLALLAYFGIESFPLLMLGTLIFTIVVTAVYGWVIERVAYKPLRNSTRLAPLISAIGISLILQNYAQIAQGARQQGVPTLLTGAWRVDVGTGFVQLTYTKIFILVAAFVGMGLLTYIIKYTKLGQYVPRDPARPQDGLNPGDQHRPRHFLRVHHRCSDGGPGRRADHHELRHVRLLRRFRHRHQSVHRSGTGRDRLAAGCDAWRDHSGDLRVAVFRSGQLRLQRRFQLLAACSRSGLRPQGLLGRPLVSKV